MPTPESRTPRSLQDLREGQTSRTASALDARKDRLRESMRCVVSGLSIERALEVGESIVARLTPWSGWQRSSAVVLFATLDGEIDTGPIFEAARSEGKGLLFPRMIPGHSLEFAPIETIRDLSPGRYGVREPVPRCPAQRLDANALVIVPGLAFDRQGGRLGRGAGYYDHALAGDARRGERACRLGIALTRQIVESVPVGAHDVKMDAVITPDALFEPE